MGDNRLIDLIEFSVLVPADGLRLVPAPAPEAAARPLEVDLVRVDEGEDERRGEARGYLLLGLHVGLELVGGDDLHLLAIDGPEMTHLEMSHGGIKQRDALVNFHF